MLNGSNAIRNQGVLYEIMTTVARIGDTVKSHCLIKRGIRLSILYMSLDRRFRIRPIGVVSKNDMGALRRRWRRLPWRPVEAATQPKVKATLAARTKTAENQGNFKY